MCITSDVIFNVCTLTYRQSLRANQRSGILTVFIRTIKNGQMYKLNEIFREGKRTHLKFYFSFFSPTEEKLASKSRPLMYNELEDCVNNSKQLYAEFGVSVHYNDSVFYYYSLGRVVIVVRMFLK